MECCPTGPEVGTVGCWVIIIYTGLECKQFQNNSAAEKNTHVDVDEANVCFFPGTDPVLWNQYVSTILFGLYVSFHPLYLFINVTCLVLHLDGTFTHRSSQSFSPVCCVSHSDQQSVLCDWITFA